VASQDHVADHYEGVRYKRPSSVKYHEDTMAQLVKLAPPRGVVLDEGCGRGAFLYFARRRAANVEDYVGIEVSRGRLTHAQRRLKLAGLNHLLVQSDACQLPFAENSFDVVHARPLLHHPSDPEGGVRELQRVLKPGGVDQTRFFGYLAYPLLGLPDLVDFEKLGISRPADGLIHVDHALARLPLIRRRGWDVMMSAHN
jgi:ubiquinone/menaquinone biosynthesis C-methylase UbiE